MSDVDNYIQKAKRLVAETHSNYDKSYEPDDFYVVWFAKTLQNWKALVSTDVEPGLYFEVTHNGSKQETYVDFYRKVSNTLIKD